MTIKEYPYFLISIWPYNIMSLRTFISCFFYQSAYKPKYFMGKTALKDPLIGYNKVSKHNCE